MSKRLTCIFCKYHWDIADDQLRPKTPICIQCQIERGLVMTNLRDGMGAENEGLRNATEIGRAWNSVYGKV